ncbi:MAG: DNA-processing protein DprA [Clostridia bacterium]|nr:DNA-processing protein DprA [Clostridia bacterium]
MDNLYYIWLSLRCGAGSESGSFLLSKFGSPEKIYSLTDDEIYAVEGLDNDTADKLTDKDLDYPERILEYCQRENVGIITPDSPIYPKRLSRIYAKPIVLYYKGKIPDVDDNVLIACVGTRNCTEHGFRTAYKLGAELAEAGAIVVSGMALGIDAACARGALAVGGTTIAVLGCGIDTIYPPQNRELFDQIVAHGAVITEYAPGASPDGAHFPVRNRIISGLSLGTCVVEADMKSGALITARHAEKQGRDVFAFPGRVGEDGSSGTNALIHSGATMVRSAKDILEEYELLYPHRIFTERITKRKYFVSADEVRAQATEKRWRREKIAKTESPNAPEMKKNAEEPTPKVKIEEIDTSAFSDVERSVFEALKTSASPDEIRSAASGSLGRTLGAGEVLAALTTLEILGVCRALPGGNYALG